MFNHAVGVYTKTGLALRLWFQMRPDMHPCAVPPDKEGFVSLDCPLHEVQRFYSDLHIDRFHTFDRQRPGVFNSSISKRVDYTTWTELLLEFRIFRIVGMFRLLLSIQMIEVTEELIEAVVGRQHVVAITQVVFAELAGRVTLLLEQHGDSWVFDLHAFRSAG